MRFWGILIIGLAFVVAGAVVWAMDAGDNRDGTAGSTSTTTTTTTTEVETTTTSEGDTTTTSTTEGDTTTTTESETTTTTEGDTTTTSSSTTTTTSSGPDETGPAISDLTISEDELTEWCEGDPEAGATLTMSLEADDPSGIASVFVSWLVDLSDGFADFELVGDRWEAEIFFESGTIFDIIEPQAVDLVIVAEDGVGNFTFEERIGPLLNPQECG